MNYKTQYLILIISLVAGVLSFTYEHLSRNGIGHINGNVTRELIKTHEHYINELDGISKRQIKLYLDKKINTFEPEDLETSRKAIDRLQYVLKRNKSRKWNGYEKPFYFALTWFFGSFFGLQTLIFSKTLYKKRKTEPEGGLNS